MKKQNFVLVTVLLLSFGGYASSQGRGQGGPGAGGGGGQRGQAGQPGPGPGSRERGGPSPEAQPRGDRGGEPIRATQQQRVQFETCTQATARVRDQARVMAEAAKSGGTNNPEFVRQHEQLRQSVQTMQQEHERFMNGLNVAQRDSLGKRIQDMDKTRDRLRERARLLDSELAKPEPDRKRIREQASEIEKAMKEWEKRYREIGSRLDVSS